MKHLDIKDLWLQQEVIKVLSQVKIRQEDDADAIERQREQERARERVNFQPLSCCNFLIECESR